MHQKGKLFASASKDESIVIWNCELIRQKSTQGRNAGSSGHDDDAVIQVLSEHEHVIDCIVWAPLEACKTIDGANYNNSDMTDVNEPNAEEINGEATEEVKDEAAGA